MRPRKYFWATMFVAVCDQNFGNSTSRCSNTGPLLPGMSASRVSHSISSNGSRPGIVKYRGGAMFAVSSRTLLTISAVSFGSVCGACVACFAVAMLSSRAEMWVTPFDPLLLCAGRGEARPASGPAMLGRRSDGAENAQFAGKSRAPSPSAV
jgi:hypothetical protein